MEEICLCCTLPSCTVTTSVGLIPVVWWSPGLGGARPRGTVTANISQASPNCVVAKIGGLVSFPSSNPVAQPTFICPMSSAFSPSRVPNLQVVLRVLELQEICSLHGSVPLNKMAALEGRLYWHHIPAKLPPFPKLFPPRAPLPNLQEFLKSH